MNAVPVIETALPDAPAAGAPLPGRARVAAAGREAGAEPGPGTPAVPDLPDPAQVREAAKRVADALKPIGNAFEFIVDGDQTVIVVRDPASNAVVRQIPAPELLQISRSLDRLQGILIRLKA